MKITAISRQKRLPANLQATEALARFFLDQRSTRTASVSHFDVVVLTLVDHADMREANAATFGKTDTTDVISVVYSPVPGETGRGSADIIINAELAIEEGARRRTTRSGIDWGACAELALYIAHGCDHLMGNVDNTPAGRRSMRRRELRWIEKARASGLLEGLAVTSVTK